MTKTVFVNGSLVTSDFLNAINNPSFVESPNNDGEIALLTDEDLTNVAGNIKPQWRAFRDALLVSAGTGLQVNVAAGVVNDGDGNLVAVSPIALSVTNNSTQYVFINSAGAPEVSTSLPVLRVPLAKVITSSGVISSIEDLRPRFEIYPAARAIKVFGGLGSQGDYNLSGTETFNQGEYYFRNFTVQAGATLTIDKFARIFCSGSVAINGSIVVTQCLLGGPGTPRNGDANRNNGAGGRVSGAGFGAGSIADPGEAYNPIVSPVGSGGASGSTTATLEADAANVGSGGAGGGGLIIEAAGTISIGGTMTAEGQNGFAWSVISGNPSVGGAGGGSGGLIMLRSLTSITVTPAATISVRGGNGANGRAGTNTPGGGGGGGGGGHVVLVSPNNNTTGATINLSGGLKGLLTGDSGAGGGSYGGRGGRPGMQGGVYVGDGAIGLLTLRQFAAVG